MSGEWKGKVALVTGGSRGLGFAICQSLGRLGCRIAVNYWQDHEQAAAAVATLREAKVDCASFPADVGSAQELGELRERVESRLGPVSILVNNAGHIARPGGWSELRGEALRRTIDTNLTGVILSIQEFVPVMVDARWGRVVNISSTYAITGAAAVMAYTAAKAGVVAITYGMAREVGSAGVTVNAIAPGNFATQMADDAGPEFKKWVESTAPVGRLGNPEEIGEAAAFLVQNPYITGHVLVVDGGHILNM